MTEPGELQRIERTLARLGRELDEARRGLEALRAAEADSATMASGDVPPTPQSPPVSSGGTSAAPGAPPRERRDRAPGAAGFVRSNVTNANAVEQFIGRYGALALAVVTIIMGAGALVSWALRQGLLTPVVRVLLGSALATLLALAGLALRARGSRPFGHTLLALALAVVHVVAWGAGPRLGLVPAWVSLTIADAASFLLALLAWRDENEELFAVGVGGALLAPFVQRSGVEQYVTLAAYGIVVCTAALRTILARRWVLMSSILVLAVFAYSRVLVEYHDGMAWLVRALAPGFVLLLAAAALLLTRPPLRVWIVLAFTATMVGTGGHLSVAGDTPLARLLTAPDLFALPYAGAALSLYAARELPPRNTRWWTAGALALPLLFLLRAVFALVPIRGSGDVGGAVQASVAGLWMLGFVAAALRESGERRGALLTTGGVVATWVAVLAVHGWPDAVPAACAVVAIVAAWVSRREAQPMVLVAALVAGVTGYAHGLIRLIAVFGFGAPFTTGPSVALAAGVAGLMIALQLVPPSTARVSSTGLSSQELGQVMIAAACFFWWRAELARAFSADAATFLLIVYYAVSGVLVLWRGRVEGSRRLRQTGLALSVWAALAALGGAFAVQQIALRVGSYLGVGAFLLGVAWWYRAGTSVSDADVGP